MDELAVAASAARGGRVSRTLTTHVQQQTYAYPTQAPAYPQPVAYPQAYTAPASGPVIHIHNTNVQQAYRAPRGDHVVTLRAQRGGEVSTEEAAGTGDDDASHARSLARATAPRCASVPRSCA